jgi:tripartite-type tricarboxylate transporter receptor subunit TctC
VVENKPGAGGRIALESLKGAPADGSVLKLSPFSCTSIYPHIYSRPFNPPHMIPLVEVGGGERTAPPGGV